MQRKNSTDCLVPQQLLPILHGLTITQKEVRGSLWGEKELK